MANSSGNQNRSGRNKRQNVKIPGERRFSVGVLLVGGAVAAVLIAFVVVIVFDARNQVASGEPEGTENVDVGEAGQHTTATVDYAQSPPAGGEHDPAWQNCGFYTQPVRSENAVHSLEHGAVWISYSPDLQSEQLQRIGEIAEGQTYILASPFEGLSSPVVASAWGKQISLDSASDPALEQFIRAFRQGPQTPEPGAACTGGVGTPS